MSSTFHKVAKSKSFLCEELSNPVLNVIKWFSGALAFEVKLNCD